MAHTEREIREAYRAHGIELGTVTPLTPMPDRYPSEALAELREVETDEAEHKFSYRGESDDDILAEWDDPFARNTVQAALIRDGEPVLRLFVNGKKSLGSYGDYRRRAR